MVCSNFKCDAVYVRWSGNTSMGSEIVVLKNHLFYLDQHDLLVFFSASLRSSRKSRWWCLSFSLIISSNLLTKWSVKRPSKPQQVVQSKFPPLSSNVTTQRRITHMSAVSSPYKTCKCQWLLVGVHFRGEKTQQLVWCVTHFELHTSQTNTYTKMCAMANLSPRNREQVGKLANVLLQGEATCARDLLGGITFRTFRTTHERWRYPDLIIMQIITI